MWYTLRGKAARSSGAGRPSGTGTGGWVQGRDYINPAIQPIFDKIVNEAWKEVIKQ